MQVTISGLPAELDVNQLRELMTSLKEKVYSGEVRIKPTEGHLLGALALKLVILSGCNFEVLASTEKSEQELDKAIAAAYNDLDHLDLGMAWKFLHDHFPQQRDLAKAVFVEAFFATGYEVSSFCIEEITKGPSQGRLTNLLKGPGAFPPQLMLGDKTDSGYAGISANEKLAFVKERLESDMYRSMIEKVSDMSNTDSSVNKFDDQNRAPFLLLGVLLERYQNAQVQL